VLYAQHILFYDRPSVLLITLLPKCFTYRVIAASPTIAATVSAISAKKLQTIRRRESTNRQSKESPARMHDHQTCLAKDDLNRIRYVQYRNFGTNIFKCWSIETQVQIISNIIPHSWLPKASIIVCSVSFSCVISSDTQDPAAYLRNSPGMRHYLCSRLDISSGIIRSIHILYTAPMHYAIGRVSAHATALKARIHADIWPSKLLAASKTAFFSFGQYCRLPGNFAQWNYRQRGHCFRPYIQFN